MKYIEYLNTGVVIDIRTKKEEAVFNTKEVSDNESLEVMEHMTSGNIVNVINNKIIFHVNEYKKRDEIVEERNALLKIAENFIDKPTYFKHLGLSVDDINDAKEYYFRLLDMPQSYDNSDDKQSWDFIFVDKYTSGKNSDTYQILKPEFIK